MSRWFVTPVLLLLLSLTVTAQAADPSHDRINNLRIQLQRAWNEAALGAENVVFVTEEPKGYGQYKPRANQTYQSVEPVIMYLEPIGYTVRKEGEFHTVNLSADFAVLDEKNQVLGEQKEFFQEKTKNRRFITEYMMFFTFNLKGLSPGIYQLRVTLHDKNSEKTAQILTPITIRP